MSYHSPFGFENAREFSCRCRAWFVEDAELLWVESCPRDCTVPEWLIELGEQRGFPVAVLEGSVWDAIAVSGGASTGP